MSFSESFHCFNTVSGNVFERKAIKCCRVLCYHQDLVKGKRPFLLMERQLKEKEYFRDTRSFASVSKSVIPFSLAKLNPNWRLTKTLTKRDEPDNFSCVTPRKRLPNVEENDYHSNEKFEYK